MRVLVAGGAGFLGSHLCDLLLGRGDEVVCVDSFVTGCPENVAHLDGVDGFELVEHLTAEDMQKRYLTLKDGTPAGQAHS